MRKILHRCLALGLSLFLILQLLPLSAWAQGDDTDTLPPDTLQEGKKAEESSDLEAEWETTGALNADGTPVTAEQGDTPEASGVVQVLSNGQPAQPASYTLTLDLDGGQVNTMQNAGWNQSSYQTYQWTRTLTEAETGQGVSLTLDSTLDGLLPGQPYRAGYSFTGWKIGETVYGTNDNQLVTITGDTTVVAPWQITTYTVSFQGSTGELWSVQVPYGSTLWTVSHTPWTADTVNWTDDNTATMPVTLNCTTYESIIVTRHPDGADAQQYYYTFTIEGSPYFTYGGPTPTKAGQHFTSWKMLSGGSGFTVTGNAVFSAQFQAEKSYVFNVYFYYENGTKAGDTLSITKTEAYVQDGKLTFDVQIPNISYYTASANQKDGVTWNGSTVTVDIDTVFGEGNTSSTNFLALTVIYKPARITYTVEYYQQSADGTGNYLKVGSTNPQNIEYGSKISIEDRPNFGSDVSFEGFQVRTDCQSAVNEGVSLREGTPNVDFDSEGNATIKIYYDRASYFIYFHTGTTEVQIDPIKVQYGSEIPDLTSQFEALTREGYEKVEKQDIDWYRLGESGELVAINETDANGTMPAYDLYAVVTWTPATTSIRLVYWVESRNAASFQNAYTKTIEGIATESELTVKLTDEVTISGDGWPSGTDGDTVASNGFETLISSHYGTDGDYTTFFSYSETNTKTSPGNVANAQVTGSGDVTEGAITGNSYTVKVNGDGTTTINIYYTRNLYTLEFVLARQNGNNLQVANKTPGTFDDSGWTDVGMSSFSFTDFATEDGVTTTNATVGETYGELQVEKTYQITEAINRDSRSAVGRYGTKTIFTGIGWNQRNYTCYVYTLTARFEADISPLWPTVENIAGTYSNYTYISMGTDTNSYYRNVFTGTNIQKNILNVYSTMDLNVVAEGTTKTNWKATEDSGDGMVAHQMVAYWASGASEYHYYFLYEVLDATVSVSDRNMEIFYPGTADQYGYSDGQYVSWNNRIYVYSTAYDIQFSTSTRSGQNQPSRQGFVSVGKRYYAGTDDTMGGNIYFFYTRETYILDIQNVDGRYTIPSELLTTEFACLAQYEEGSKTLKNLGWESVNADGTVSIRYGGYLTPLAEEEIITWLTDETGGDLAYPYQSAGESQYYFWRWYRNQMQTMPVEWETDNEMQTMTSNKTLYAGWFTPRYTTSYVLNGGTWEDSIDYTLTTSQTSDGHTVYIYYPHEAQLEDAPLYWYVQSKTDDRLFVDTLYVCKVGDVAHKNETGAHWELNEDLTVEEMLKKSSEDLQGTRLVNHYYCYMGAGPEYNHDYYININSAVNTVLDEPAEPTRTGYTFRGWFYFDNEPASGTKTYLKDVLTGTQSLASYEEGYVYLNHVGDAFLLHKDENGQLFYYPEQTGYRFSYANDASVVVRDLQLYAAWEPKGDANAVVYHMVKKSDVEDGITSFTPKDGDQITIDSNNTITIGGTEYYILETEELASLFTGSTYPQTAREYYTDISSKKWLPAQATIDLYADSRTQTVTSDNLASVTGNTYRIEQPDGTYTYYTFFVYNATDEVVYNVYAIDLSVAVAEGVLDSYLDTFDRSFQVDTTAPYFLSVEQKSVKVDIIETTFVVENAPTVSGYTVYQDWSQELQLQTDASANNIFFYYVRDSAQISYSITYYLMVDGSYSSNHTVTISNIPAVTGEIISLTDMASTYDRLVTMAQTYSTYSDSTNDAQKSLYDRYKEMTVTWTQNGTSTSFTVDTTVTDTLNLSDIADFHLDYYVDGWSPTGSSLVVSSGTEVEVYLATAQLIVQKVDTSQVPLAGAEFQLERLVEDADGTILYDGKSYAVDTTFHAVTATSGEDGKTIFYNLSARVFEDGKGYLYRLTETQAPKGYNCLAEPLYVTTPYTVEEETHYSVTYTVVNTGIAYLPAAGVFGGVYTTIFLGVGLMTGALGSGFLLWKRGCYSGKHTKRKHTHLH